MNTAKVAIKYARKTTPKIIIFFLINSCTTIADIKVNNGNPIRINPIGLTSIPSLFSNIIKAVKKITNKLNITLINNFLFFKTVPPLFVEH